MGKTEHIKLADIKGLLEENAEDLYENAPCGYLSTLPNGTFIKINRTFLNWLGYGAEELLFLKKLQDLLPVGGKIYYETHYEPLLRMQGFLNEVNFYLKSKQGHQLPVLVNTTQIKGKDGQPLLNRTTVFNITDRKKYEQELLRAKKEAEAATRIKAEFLSTVSHEIRTPMNAIISIANLLQGMHRTPEQEEYFRTLKFSADNLLQLINDVLDYSKIEAGRVALAERPLNLKDLVHAIIHGVSITAQEKGLPLRVELDPRLPATVIGDPVKIGQVLTNLLSNAIKFTAQGYVLLKLQVQDLAPEQVTVSFSVKDTGIGIPKDKLEKVFQEFAQADYEINLKYGGTGLGLSISQKLLALYGSKLTVESEEGKGTTFSFHLRLRIGDTLPALTPPPEAAALPQQPVKGVRVLLVDDNAVNVMVVSKYLDKWGVLYDVATNGYEAVEKVRQQEYELVLMDLQMPEMDGYEATSKIRSLGQDKYRRLPVIALSASAGIDHEDRMEAAGINDFVSKPFNATELQSKIAYYTRSAAPAPAPLQRQRPLPPPQHAPADGPEFSLETLEELLDDNEVDLEELVGMTIRNFEAYKAEFRASLVSDDLKWYRAASHKIKTTIDMLHAGKLQAAISEGRSLLEKRAAEGVALEQAAREITKELDAVIDGLKETLKNRWHRPGDANER